MSLRQGYRLIWNELRLTVEALDREWQAFVYDERRMLLLYRAERLSIHGAKVAAIEFSLGHVFGPDHREDPDRLAERLPWESLSETAQ
jgi:hypothetical protein